MGESERGAKEGQREGLLVASSGQVSPRGRKDEKELEDRMEVKQEQLKERER